MSRMEQYVSAQRKHQLFQQKHPVVNYMGGISYQWNPVDTLKLVTASSIFGEPAYYRDGAFAWQADMLPLHQCSMWRLLRDLNPCNRRDSPVPQPLGQGVVW